MTARRRPVLAAAALMVLASAATIPLPSVDQAAALGQLSRLGGAWVQVFAPFPPAFSILSTGLVGLVLARLALGLAVNPRLRSSADTAWTATIAALFVAASWLGGVAMSLTLHQRFTDLYTVEPILGALVDGTAVAVGAALLWSLATLVRSSGIASGALLLFGAWEALRIVRYTVELVAAALSGEPDLLPLTAHTGLLPLALMLVALWRWRPGPDPIPVWRGLTVRGPLDLLILPLAAGAVASLIADDLLGYPSWTPQPPLYDPGLVPRTLASVLAVPAIGAWARRRPGRPGGWGYLLGAAALLALNLGLVAIVLAWPAAPPS